MLEIFHLSYYEPFADETYQALCKKFPWAKRVSGVKGIFYGHKECARQSLTSMFYVVDADAILEEGFDFSYTPQDDKFYWSSVKQTDCIHVWRCKNSVNDLVYGYGGVKLFPTEPVRNATDWHIDFTTSVAGKFKAMEEISNSTYINSDPFSAFKSGFRECTKLASRVIKDPEGYYSSENDPRIVEWLNVWCTKGADRENGEWAITGAKAGRTYGEMHKGNTEALDKINDRDWLQEQYKLYC